MTWHDELWSLITKELAPQVGSRFTIWDLYQFADDLANAHPNNRHVRETIRDKVQDFRELGLIEFVDEEGTYRRTA